MYSVVVTAGPTYEFLDQVRYIANRSSGKQGYCIASSFLNKGCNVHLVSGPTSILKPNKCNVIDVVSCQDMMNACEMLLPVDIVVCAAAVCDFRPKRFFNKKLSKMDISSIELELNSDILRHISTHGALRPKVVIGFSLECERNLDASMKKLNEKGCDILIVNSLELDNKDTVMGSDYNKVSILSLKRKPIHLPMMKKEKVGDYIAEYVIQYIKIV